MMQRRGFLASLLAFMAAPFARVEAPVEPPLYLIGGPDGFIRVDVESYENHTYRYGHPSDSWHTLTKEDLLRGIRGLGKGS